MSLGIPGFFETIRPLAATYARRSPAHRVAVVGNAPLEPSLERAQLIDSADLVVRVNGFALDEPDGAPTLGTHADIVVFNRAVQPTPWVFDRYPDRLYLLIEPGRMTWERGFRPPSWPQDLGYVTVSNRDVIVPCNTEMGLDAEADGEWATTGTTAVWMTRHLFPEAELVVTGLSMLDDPEQTSWEHAYGTPCPVGPEHRIDVESGFLATWVNEGRIRFER